MNIEIWNEAYNIYVETGNKLSMLYYLDMKVIDGEITKSERDWIADDVIDTAML